MGLGQDREGPRPTRPGWVRGYQEDRRRSLNLTFPLPTAGPVEDFVCSSALSALAAARMFAGMSTERAPEQLHLRVPPDLSRALQAAARADNRTVSNLVTTVLRAWLASTGSSAAESEAA